MATSSLETWVRASSIVWGVCLFHLSLKLDIEWSDREKLNHDEIHCSTVSFYHTFEITVVYSKSHRRDTSLTAS